MFWNEEEMYNAIVSLLRRAGIRPNKKQLRRPKKEIRKVIEMSY